MSVLTACTLTGIDGETPLPALAALAHQFPLVEFGVLYSASRSQRPRPRYPDRRTIQHMARTLTGYACRLALHVCGGDARGECDRGELRDLAWPFQRVQLNGTITAAEVERACRLWPDKWVITQDNGTGTLWQDVQAPNHAILMDASGGRGTIPRGWSRQPTEKPCGFAGGLTPANLEVHLPRIQVVARHQWWLDMESGIRDPQNRFDLRLAREALCVVFGEP